MCLSDRLKKTSALYYKVMLCHSTSLILSFGVFLIEFIPLGGKAKSFLLGVQLSFSFYLLYMNIFGTEISRFI